MMMMWKGVIGTEAGPRENPDVSNRGSGCIAAGSRPVMWHHPSDAMERSGGAESAPTYQTVNLNISNITVQVRKAGSSFLGARLTFHFVEQQTSESSINTALGLWAASVLELGGDIPWSNTQELYATIDSIQHGEAPWRTYKPSYNGPLPQGTPP